MSKQNTNLVDKLKTALQRLLKWTETHTGIYSIRVCPKKDDPDKVAKEKVRAIALAHNVLSLQRRNCDVGTVKEQTERFNDFCERNMQHYKDMFGDGLDGWDCKENCPVGKMIDCGKAVADRCQLAWAQLPYEESNGASK